MELQLLQWWELLFCRGYLWMSTWFRWTMVKILNHRGSIYVIAREWVKTYWWEVSYLFSQQSDLMANLLFIMCHKMALHCVNLSIWDDWFPLTGASWSWMNVHLTPALTEASAVTWSTGSSVCARWALQVTTVRLTSVTSTSTCSCSCGRISSSCCHTSFCV